MTFGDYRSLAAINREDLVIWNEAEAQREKDRRELEARNTPPVGKGRRR